MYHLKHLSLGYQKVLFDDASLQIPEGLITLITGDNGCGKSTLIYILNRLLILDDEKYYHNDHLYDLSSPSKNEKWRADYVGMVSQEPKFYHVKTIRDAFKLASSIGKCSLDDTSIKEYLSMMRLDCQLDGSLETLSGGEKQRLSLALALCKKPHLLLLDEPTSALEKEDCTLFMQVLMDALSKQKLTVVMISHQEQMQNYAHWIYRIENKKIHLVSKRGKENKQRHKRRVEKNNEWFKLLLLRTRKQLVDYWYLLLMMGIMLFFTLGNKMMDQSLQITPFVEDPYGVVIINHKEALMDESYYEPFSKETIEALQKLNLVSELQAYSQWLIDGYEIKIHYQLDHDVVFNQLASKMEINLPIKNVDGSTTYYPIAYEDYGSIDDGASVPTIYIAYDLVKDILNAPTTKISALRLVISHPLDAEVLENTLKNLNPDWTIQSTRQLKQANAEVISKKETLKSIFTLTIIVSTIVLSLLFITHEQKQDQNKWDVLLVFGLTKTELRLVVALRILIETMLIVILTLSSPLVLVLSIGVALVWLAYKLIFLKRYQPLTVMRS